MRVPARPRERRGVVLNPCARAPRYDIVVVVVSYLLILLGADGGAASVCRLLRLLKIMNKLEELRGILLGLAAGLSAVASIMLLLLLVIFLYAIAGIVLFGENDPFHFGGVGRAMLTLFQVATLAGWTDIYRINYFGCDRHTGGVYQEGPPSRVHTVLGSYDRAQCHAPAAAPIGALALRSCTATCRRWRAQRPGG